MSFSRKVLLVLSVSALFMGPVAPILNLTDFDTAFAKSEKGGGNGGGGGSSKSGGNSDKGNSGNGNSGGNSGGGQGGSGSSAGGNADKGNSSDKAGGKSGGDVSAETASTDGADTETDAGGKPAKGSKAKGATASSLGNMNAAFNASPKAVLAHMRNGSFNGPVGRVAALAVADAAIATVDVEATLAAKEAYDAWLVSVTPALEAAGYGSLEDYIIARDAYLASLPPVTETPVEEAPVEGEPVAETTEEVPAEEPAEPAFVFIPEIDSSTIAPPDADAVAAIQTVADAEAAILDKWNKNPDSDPATLTGEEAAMLAAVRAHIAELGLTTTTN